MRASTFRLLFCVFSTALFYLPQGMAVEKWRSVKKVLAKNESVTVGDNNFTMAAWSNVDEASVRLNNSIAIRFKDESSVPAGFFCKAEVLVEYFKRPSSAVQSEVIQLSLSKSPGSGAIKVADTYTMPQDKSGAKITVKILSVKDANDVEMQAVTDIEFFAEVVVDRRFLFDPTGYVEFGNELATEYTKINNVVNLSWNPYVGAEEYDIEWTLVDEGNKGRLKTAHDMFLSNGSIQAVDRLPDNILNELFRNNSTRITTEANKYSVSVVSSGRYVLVRMRPARYINGVRIEGENWQYHQNQITSYGAFKYAIWEIGWHSPALNWSYTAAYAEEGKKKEVISYLDGTLRQRQTVTVNNSDNTFIAQENIYDQFGRQTISVLPAPVMTLTAPVTLQYFNNLNRNITNLPYSYRDLSTEDNCDLKAGRLTALQPGAAQYYSSENPLSSVFNKNYIPDAEGYPYSLTQYVADNTGRIRIQGGVGPKFQPGSEDSKVTKYYYGKPEQWELDRIFGNEAGLANHYLKNMVADPNGQLSISYINPSGKIVATALTSLPPGNLDKLENANIPLSGSPEVKSEILLRPEQFVFDESSLTLSATATYLASSPKQNVKVSYSIEQLIADYQKGGGQFCSQCEYNLNIRVVDACGAEYHNQSLSVNTGGSLLADCNPLEPYKNGFEIEETGDAGEYYINFSFFIDKEIVDAGTTKFIADAQAAGKIDKRVIFLRQEIEKANFAADFSDCKTCRSKLGTLDVFKSVFIEKLSALGLESSEYSDPAIIAFINNLYNTLTLQCSQSRLTCSDSQCDIVEQAMLRDLEPGGQFAIFTDDYLPLEPEVNILSIYYKGIGGVFTPPAGGVSAEEERANTITLEDGTTLSAYSPSFTLEHLVKYWKPEWGQKFLKYHPEYCKLKFCRETSAFRAWDYRVETLTNTQAEIDEILGSGPFNNDSYLYLFNHDPFFNSTGALGNTPEWRSKFITKLLNYSKEILPSVTPIKNINQYVTYSLYCSRIERAANDNSAWGPGCIPECRIKEREWQQFKSIYFQLKQKVYEEIRTTSANYCKDICAVGQPFRYSYGASSCPDASKFVLRVSEGESICGGTEQKIILSYSDGAVPRDLTVNLKYPSRFGGLSLPLSFSFIKGELSKSFCIPSYINVNHIVIKSSECYCTTTTVLSNNWIKERQRDIRHDSNGNVTADITYNDVDFYTFNSNNTYTFKPDPYDTYQTSGTWHLDNNACRLILDQGTPQERRFSILSATSNSLELYELLGDREIIRYYKVNPCNISGDFDATERFEEHNYAWLRDQVQNGGSIHTYTDITPTIVDNAWVNIVAISDMPFGDPCIYKHYYPYMAANAQFYCSQIGGFVDEPNYQCSSPYSQSPSAKWDSYSNSYYADQNQYVWADNWYFYSHLSQLHEHTKFYDCFTITLNNVTKTFKDVYVLKCPIPGYWFRWVLSGNSYSSFPDSDNYEEGNEYLYLQQPGQSQLLTTSLENNSTSSLSIDLPLPPPVPGCETLKYKKTRFPTVDISVPAEVNGFQYQAEQAAIIKDQIKSSCEENAAMWMEALSEGLDEANLSLQQRDLLRQRLINLCIAGGDPQHPFGASTLAPGKTSSDGFSSFEAIIKAILPATYNAQFSAKLNPWLIDFPYPYETAVQISPKASSETNASICNRLTTIAAEAPGNDGYLLEKLGISAAELQDLRNSCTSCNYLLQRDIVLPALLEGGNTACIDKSTVSTVLTYLQSKIAAFSSTSTNYAIVLTNYLNHKYGTSFSENAFLSLMSDKTSSICPKSLFPSVKEDPYAMMKTAITRFVTSAFSRFDNYISSERRLYQKSYIKTCGAARASARLEAAQGIYHYTLYYYDGAGNLVKTVPPAGVKVLNTSQLKDVEAVRKYGVTDCSSFPPSGISIGTTENEALASVSEAIAQNGSSLEFWLYHPNRQSSQVLLTTNDTRYMLNACINNSRLSIDIFQMTTHIDGSATITGSNHITADIRRKLPLSDWTHIVVQAQSWFTEGALKLFVDGEEFKGADLASGSPNAGCGWEIMSQPGTSTLQFPRNIADLKHVRTYHRILGVSEIELNAASNCMVPSGVTQAWTRLNIPAPGSVTTTGPGSTTERRYDFVIPAHTLVTIYEYNTLNQVSRQNSPDGGETRFWYDYKGRLVASQNAKQYPSKYSYTRYDNQGRIIEVGEKNPIVYKPASETSFLNDQFILDFMDDNNVANRYVTRTFYEQVPAAFSQSRITQTNLYKRVAASIYQANTADAWSATYYSYDIAGNVDKLWQLIPGLGLQQFRYQYDLVSGKVNFVEYINREDEQKRFYYRYAYDAENRITHVYNGTNGVFVSEGGSYINDERQLAKYYYYLHGPLSRVEITRDEETVLQGLDYAYTLQGWLKGVNGQRLNGNLMRDEGSTIPKDIMAFSLGYYEGDYKPINATASAFASWVNNGPASTGVGLYNGNIGQMNLSLSKFSDVGYSYRYDQLNRLVKMRQVGTDNKSRRYAEDISYDPNGNIMSYKRNGPEGEDATHPEGVLMDDLEYSYKSGTNQLIQVTDRVTASSGYNDLKNGQESDNYKYDAIGNLMQDKQEGILQDIEWNVSGKIEKIIKTVANGNMVINYGYDASGNRISKTVTRPGEAPEITYYVRDVQGNTLATYKESGPNDQWTEQFLFGSSRLAVWKPESSGGHESSKLWTDRQGSINFELSNHLGNVLGVISDKRIPVTTNGVTMYEADVVSAQDYYPGGMIQPGRSFSSSSYRYGFGGKENDNEVKGDGNSVDFGSRVYDTRLVRWLSLDPLQAKYPDMSPYNAFGNSPIIYKDPDGRDIVYFNSQGKETKRIVSKTQFETWVEANNNYVQAPMPKIIKGYEAPRFQKYDYDIAAQTFIFNSTPADQRPKTPGGKAYAGEQPVDLDPTIVKSMIMQETHMGTDKGHGKNDATQDIMQANVWYSETSNDWGDYKKAFGLKEAGGATPSQSIYAGIRILFIKGLKTDNIYKDKKVVGTTTGWRGGDLTSWWSAVRKYNGGGVKDYDGQVKKKYDNATDPKPENYYPQDKDKKSGN